MLTRGKSFVTLRGMSRESLINVVEKINANGMDAPVFPDGRAVATAFYEASTRTRLGFYFAARALGLDVIPLDVSASSVRKGESLTDTIRVMADYGIAALILRHPTPESMDIATAASDCPVINAGNGVGEHPVQTLIDLAMIYRRFGRFSDLNVTMTGDMLNSRTIHGLVMALAMFDNRITLVAAPELRLRPAMATNCVEIGYLAPDILASTDVLYMTRVQVERGSTNRPIILTEQVQQELNPDAIVLHPMPRTIELPEWFDTDPRAVYLKRNRIGLGVMEFILREVLGN